MLQITPKHLIFHLFEKYLSLKLDNQDNQSVIFKVKSTNTNLISVTPNIGFIKDHTQLSLLVTAIKKSYFQQKLQISYAFISHQPVDFDHSWEEAVKNKLIKNQIIIISREEYKIEEIKKQNLEKNIFEERKSSRQLIKSLQKPVHYENFEDPQMQMRTLLGKSTIKKDLSVNKLDQQAERAASSIQRRIQAPFSKSKEVNQNIMTRLENERKKYFDSQQIEYLKFQLSELKKQLQQQGSSNFRLKQQLLITEQKLKVMTEQCLQVKINKSIGIICDQYHTSFTYLLVFALGFFVLGFTLGCFR